MLVARALKNSQLTCGERHAYLGDRTLVHRVISRRHTVGFKGLDALVNLDSDFALLRDRVCHSLNHAHVLQPLREAWLRVNARR